MPRLSMNELTTYRWSFDEDVHHFQRAGYQALGVWRRKLADFGEQRAVELLNDAGMAVSNLMWAGGFTGNDGRSLVESVDDARSAIETAALVQAGCLVLYTGGRNNHTLRHADRLVRSALDELLPLAEQCGVTLAVEPMHPACAAEWTILTSLEDALDLIAEYASPYLKLVYDTYHFPLQHSQRGYLADLAPAIAVVHLGDRRETPSIDQDRCPLGAGQNQVQETIETLIESGYEGDFDVELMGWEVESIGYETLLTNSRELYLDAVSAVGAVGR